MSGGWRKRLIQTGGRGMLVAVMMVVVVVMMVVFVRWAVLPFVTF